MHDSGFVRPSGVKYCELQHRFFQPYTVNSAQILVASKYLPTSSAAPSPSDHVDAWSTRERAPGRELVVLGLDGWRQRIGDQGPPLLPNGACDLTKEFATEKLASVQGKTAVPHVNLAAKTLQCSGLWHLRATSHCCCRVSASDSDSECVAPALEPHTPFALVANPP